MAIDQHRRRLLAGDGERDRGRGADLGDEREDGRDVDRAELLERHGHLALAGETGARRYATGAYGAWALHVGGLLSEADLGDCPALVDALLAPLAPDVFAHQRAGGLSARRIADDLATLAGRMLGAG
jgi:hypothetical protein